MDEAFAWYLDAHVRGGYDFLMQNYRPGDKICLFGFSRGAYTARALAGMLHKVGLLPRDNPEQVPFAYKLYKRTDPASITLAAGFKRTFCRGVRIEFVGVWETVASVGVIFSRTLPFITSNTTIKTFRHALSLDEHRAKFRPNLYHRPAPSAQASGKNPDAKAATASAPILNEKHKQKEMQKSSSLGKIRKWTGFLPNRSSKPGSLATDQTHLIRPMRDFEKDPANVDLTLATPDEVQDEDTMGPTDVLEVWFPGCHSDIGGSAVSDSTKLSLSDITLRWMVRHVVLAQCGVAFDNDALARANIPEAVFIGIGFPVTLPPTERTTAGAPVPSSSGSDSGSSDPDSGSADPNSGSSGPLTPAAMDKEDAVQPLHDELKLDPLWWLLEIVPTSYNWQDKKGRWHTSWSIHLGRGRHLPQKPIFHITVQERMNDAALKYTPKAVWPHGTEIYVQ
ncbi:hypothetical protein AcW1_007484 [Taiwanofungus camphoratus]|nr:hypothetical protein AcW1_007484 [Antrodia cinnamomea]